MPPRRRRPYTSCELCRTRKRRCNLPLPCGYCTERNVQCRLPASAASTGRGRSIPGSAVDSPQEQRQGQHQFNQEDFLAQIGVLRRLTQQLESRVVQSTAPASPQRRDSHGGEPEVSHGGEPEVSHGGEPEVSHGSEAEVSPSPSTGLPITHSEVAAHLQRVSMGQSSHEPIYDDDIVFKVERIRAISQIPTYTSRLGKPTPCVWLPRHAEAKMLLDCYVTDLSYIQHVVHTPSLPAAIDDAYRQIDGQEPVKPGSLILLLSIIANATHVWAPRDDIDSEHSLFWSSAQAHAQTPMWIKATHTVLNATQNGAALALETIQGLIILSFVVCNLEGVSLRYRSLISTALLLGRELGLHWIDRESNAVAANTLEAEMGRRVWWYLVATDWLLAARYGGPREGVYETHPLHMMVNKPRNINDVDPLGNGLESDLPMSQPTDMSYFLQRVRLAEISRSVVDYNLMAATSSGRPSYYAHIMAMDVELDRMIHNIPPFLQLDSYKGSPDRNKASGTLIQAYMLNSLMYTQRCKLHLAYVTSGPNNNPAYASSRHTCLESARQIIRAEAQLLRSQHPFVRVRLRLAAIVHSVSMAGIVLLMDACVNWPSSLRDEILHGDVAEALRIIEDAKSYSLAAANLHESLMQILAKHRAQQQQQISQVPVPVQQGGASAAAAAAPVMNTESQYAHPRSNWLSIISSGSTGHFSDQLSAASSQPAQSLDNTVYLEDINWDELFSGIGSASFF